MSLGPLELLVVLLIVLGLAYFVGRAARKKGYSFAGFFLLTLFTIPIALILLIVLPDRRAPRGPAAPGP